MALRKLLVGGNWKCNGTMDFATKFPKEVLHALKFDAAKVEVVVAPSLIHLTTVQQALQGTNVQVSAQNSSLYGLGAFTGELSAEMLVDAQIPWVILGHSERRHVMGESDEVVGKKTALALKHGRHVMACIGEQLSEREAKKTDEVNARQLAAILKETGDDWSKVVVAYEPVWAIGTGVTASPEQAQEAHDFVRGWIKSNVSQKAADETRILYGGSVTDKNADELIMKPDVDGFLVGGASLKDAFKDIVRACQEAK
jgi:triosephosphate isomerase (TIM)